MVVGQELSPNGVRFLVRWHLLAVFLAHQFLRHTRMCLFHSSSIYTNWNFPRSWRRKCPKSLKTNKAYLHNKHDRFHLELFPAVGILEFLNFLNARAPRLHSPSASVPPSGFERWFKKHWETASQCFDMLHMYVMRNRFWNTQSSVYSVL